MVYLAYVHTCPASLRTGITKEPNFSYGKSHCQSELEVSDLRLLHFHGNSNDSVGVSVNLISLFFKLIILSGKEKKTNPLTLSPPSFTCMKYVVSQFTYSRIFSSLLTHICILTSRLSLQQEISISKLSRGRQSRAVGRLICGWWALGS